MMETGSRQMTAPPDRHNEPEPQPIQALFVHRHARFQIPAATFGILKGRVDTHAPGRLVHTCRACWPLRHHHPFFFISFSPTSTDLGWDARLPARASPGYPNAPQVA
jgi:hypothetical protein